MEWSFAAQQLVAHYADSPNVHFVAVSSFFQKLGRTVKRSATNAELRVGALVDNCAETEVRYHCSKVALREVELFEEALFIVCSHSVDFRMVWEMQQDISQFDVSVND